MRMSDWSSDVCSSDLGALHRDQEPQGDRRARGDHLAHQRGPVVLLPPARPVAGGRRRPGGERLLPRGHAAAPHGVRRRGAEIGRAHSELQSLMCISYAVFCLKKKKNITNAREIVRPTKTHYQSDDTTRTET